MFMQLKLYICFNAHCKLYILSLSLKPKLNSTMENICYRSLRTLLANKLPYNTIQIRFHVAMEVAQINTLANNFKLYVKLKICVV